MEKFKVKALICKVLKGDRRAFGELKSLSLSEKEAEQMRKVFIALLSLVGRGKGKISYSQLSTYANQLYKNHPLPERGGSLARVLGSILGDLSLLSYCCCGFLISSVVIREYDGKHGKGFYELVSLLGEDASRIEEWVEKTQKIARELTK